MMLDIGFIVLLIIFIFLGYRRGFSLEFFNMFKYIFNNCSFTPFLILYDILIISFFGSYINKFVNIDFLIFTDKSAFLYQKHLTL